MSDSERISPVRPADPAAMERAITDFLEAAGFDTQNNQHLRNSGNRVAEAWSNDLLEGHSTDPVTALGEPFAESSSDLVLLKDIEFSSSCPHHLMPYKGVAHIAYLPAGRAVGFSGPVRLLDSLAHRLTLQEWLSRDLADVLMDVLRPRGAACLIEATPMCVFARGIRRPCRIATSAFRGAFADEPELRSDLVATCLGKD